MPTPRVLVATDMSEPSLDALRFARRIAEPGGHTYAVFVAPPPDSERVRADAGRVLAQWLQRNGAGDAEPIVLQGSPGRAIAREAVALGVHLVVLGAQGRSRLERVLLGSTARVVMRHAPVDTLVARTDRAITRIVVGTDFETPATAAIARAAEIAQRVGAEVTLAHVVETDLYAEAVRDEGHDTATRVKIAEDRLGQIARAQLGGRAKVRVATGRAPVELAKMAAQEGAQLIVVGSHGAGFAERALLGSTAEAIVERAPCSVLVVRQA